MSNLSYFWDWLRYRRITPTIWVRRSLLRRLDTLGVTPYCRRIRRDLNAKIANEKEKVI